MSQSSGNDQRLFPYRPPIEYTPSGRKVVVVDENEQTDSLDAVTSETAQEILSVLSENPNTVSNIADEIDSSVQNVAYHLNRLDEGGIITPVQTWYSEKGKPMTVYGLASDELVVRFRSERSKSGDSNTRASP